MQELSRESIIGLVVTAVLSVGLIVLFIQGVAGDETPTDVNISEVLSDNVNNTKGAEEDPVVVINEFSDFECPYCKDIAPELQRIVDTYSDDGVQFAYRHFPLIGIHDRARDAAYASEAAANQDMFWEMHDQIFATQAEWQDLGSDEAEDFFVGLAEDIEIEDVDKFKDDYNGSEVRERVEKDELISEELGLTSTPTIYVNDVLVPNGQINYAGISEIVEAELVEAGVEVSTGSAEEQDTNDETTDDESGEGEEESTENSEESSESNTE